MTDQERIEAIQKRSDAFPQQGGHLGMADSIAYHDFNNNAPQDISFLLDQLAEARQKTKHAAAMATTEIENLRKERDESQRRATAAEEELKHFRVRVFGLIRATRSDHTTACAIWGDDGQGGTPEKFEEPLPCTCGALLNYEKRQSTELRAELERQIAARDGYHRNELEARERSATMSVKITQLYAELERERGLLDWVLNNCDVMTGDFGCVTDRKELDAAMVASGERPEITGVETDGRVAKPSMGVAAEEGGKE